MAAKEEEGKKKKIQIYASTTTSSRQVTPYWREKYERDAKKYWDIFYKRHQDKFFKDRHYLDKEWGDYFQAREGQRLVILEAGCGAGNTIFPLVSTFPDIFVHACDFSPRAIDLVKVHKDYRDGRVNAFVCDITVDDLSENILPSSVDVVTMVFVLSAVAPEKMPLVLQNIKMVLKPNGHVLLRDYAVGDLAQERFTSKDQQISENFYVRGDGTRAFYFSNDFLTTLFTRNGFQVEEVGVCYKQVENRSLDLLMNRRWIQAVFRANSFEGPKSADNLDLLNQEMNGDTCNKDHHMKEHDDDNEIDMSDGIVKMFGISPSIEEVIEIKLRDHRFRVKVLGKENQHTCKSTGLMLWESAHFMCTILAENPSIVAGKRVLELGCGSAGICSMAAIQSADLLVATDGDAEALDLLKENLVSNVEPVLMDKMVIKRMVWGDKEQVHAVKNLVNHTERRGFNIIIGTDVTYNPNAVTPLFETARELIGDRFEGAEMGPALIICHIQRRVDEDSIIEAATRCGFRLVDRLVNGVCTGGIISSWLSSSFSCENAFQFAALNIMYFCV